MLSGESRPNLRDYGTQFYVGVRNHDFDNANGPAVDDIVVGAFGTRVEF